MNYFFAFRELPLKGSGMKTNAESKKLEALRAGNKIATLSSICIREIRAKFFITKQGNGFYFIMINLDTDGTDDTDFIAAKLLSPFRWARACPGFHGAGLRPAKNKNPSVISVPRT